VEETGTDERQARAARNQSIFREVNERLEAINESLALASETATFVCECADLGCTEMIDLTLVEYESVRRESNEFFVLPGHVYPDVEKVVAEKDRYVVVAKIEEAAKLAEAFDPRT
jgi:hypothetical protein